MNTEPDNIKLLGEHRRGETFELGCHKYVDFLSHGTVLEDCTLKIHSSSRGVVFHAATLRRCTIQMKRQFTNFSWHDVVLEECRFQGWFIGNDFGPRPDAYPDAPQGIVSSCDFSQAKMDACRFFRTDMSTQQLPKWPCFTVLEPAKNAADWLSIPFPERYRRIEQKLIAEVSPDYNVKGIVATTEHAGKISKKHHISVDEIKALVSNRSYIVL